MSEEWPTPTCVYGLWSTSDRVIRYVGQTTEEPRSRLRGHLHSARKGSGVAVARWIREEMAAGHEIEMKVLHPYGDAAVSEIEYIALYRHLGAPLLNRTSGSSIVSEREGQVVSLETRLKISAALKGKKHTEEARMRLSLAGQRRARAKRAQGQYCVEMITHASR